MSVRNGFTIEIYGLCIVYVPFWHMPLMMPSQQRIEDDGRLENESRDTENS